MSTTQGEIYILLLPKPGNTENDGDDASHFVDPVAAAPKKRTVKISLLILGFITLVLSASTFAGVGFSLASRDFSIAESGNSSWSVNSALGKVDHNVGSEAPADKVNETEAQVRAKTEMVDRLYCGHSPCQFLFMAYISEQESKAQLHFKNWAFLSGLLNRTLVLPQVYRSRMGACHKFPFFNYYSPSFLTSNAASFSYITHADFLSWSREYPLPVTAQTVYMHRLDVEEKPANYKPPLLANLKGNTCARDQYGLDFAYEAYENPLVVFKMHDYWKEDGKKKMLEHVLGTLNDPAVTFGRTNETKGDKAKVMMVDTYLVWEPFVPNPAALTPMDYNVHWQTVAKNIASQLSPYVAIHWRMETVPAENLPQCARDLVSTIRELDGIFNVYLATDYPLQDHTASANSGTFRNIQPQHREAIDILKEAVGNLTWAYLVFQGPLAANSTVIGNHTLPVPLDPVALAEHDRRAPGGRAIPVVIKKDFDRGYLAILDKLVSVEADHFIGATPQQCGRGSSSFTAQIIKMRAARVGKKEE
ncbi:hypothetical protein BC936DRAFT_144561 [Jimgerdemannia flammicorona]|uniref:GDP-fucose protein O-fucosyltransferase-domain-containing protein n=1 Tax=Jimgerdemannia flammicorona TaxID=994334 RepID=A0A433DC82_9FUNG|nr:hypothetical protein BC936DRAFT_144561 [Jimgerdemannia flammicorona]